MFFGYCNKFWQDMLIYGIICKKIDILKIANNQIKYNDKIDNILTYLIHPLGSSSLILLQQETNHESNVNHLTVI